MTSKPLWRELIQCNYPYTVGSNWGESAWSVIAGALPRTWWFGTHNETNTAKIKAELTRLGAKSKPHHMYRCAVVISPNQQQLQQLHSVDIHTRPHTDTVYWLNELQKFELFLYIWNNNDHFLLRDKAHAVALIPEAMLPLCFTGAPQRLSTIFNDARYAEYIGANKIKHVTWLSAASSTVLGANYTAGVFTADKLTAPTKYTDHQFITFAALVVLFIYFGPPKDKPEKSKPEHEQRKLSKLSSPSAIIRVLCEVCTKVITDDYESKLVGNGTANRCVQQAIQFLVRWNSSAHKNPVSGFKYVNEPYLFTPTVLRQYLSFIPPTAQVLPSSYNICHVQKVVWYNNNDLAGMLHKDEDYLLQKTLRRHWSANPTVQFYNMIIPGATRKTVSHNLSQYDVVVKQAGAHGDKLEPQVYDMHWQGQHAALITWGNTSWEIFQALSVCAASPHSKAHARFDLAMPLLQLVKYADNTPDKATHALYILGLYLAMGATPNEARAAVERLGDKASVEVYEPIFVSLIYFDEGAKQLLQRGISTEQFSYIIVSLLMPHLEHVISVTDMANVANEDKKVADALKKLCKLGAPSTSQPLDNTQTDNHAVISSNDGRLVTEEWYVFQPEQVRVLFATIADFERGVLYRDHLWLLLSKFRVVLPCTVDHLTGIIRSSEFPFDHVTKTVPVDASHPRSVKTRVPQSDKETVEEAIYVPHACLFGYQLTSQNYVNHDNNKLLSMKSCTPVDRLADLAGSASDTPLCCLDMIRNEQLGLYDAYYLAPLPHQNGRFVDNWVESLVEAGLPHASYAEAMNKQLGEYQPIQVLSTPLPLPATSVAASPAARQRRVSTPAMHPAPLSPHQRWLHTTEELHAFAPPSVPRSVIEPIVESLTSPRIVWQEVSEEEILNDENKKPRTGITPTGIKDAKHFSFAKN